VGDNEYTREIRKRLLEDPTIQEILRNFEQGNRCNAERHAREHPEKHRLSKIIANGKDPSSRYWTAGKDAEGRRIMFGWCCWKNIGNRYLSFREVWDEAKGEGFRDRWVAHKTRKGARAWAERAVESFKEEAIRRLPNAPTGVKAEVDRLIG